jgi:hypothetical protein
MSAGTVATGASTITTCLEAATMADARRAFGALRALAALVVLGCLTVGVGTASAAYVHQAGVSEQFGTDGTDATTIRIKSFALDQSRQRLYVSGGLLGNADVYGFDVAGATTHTPLGGGFPIPVEYTGSAAVDETSGLETSGNIYVQFFFTGIYGFTSTGATLSGYPLPPAQQQDECAAAVDPDGHLWVSDRKRGQLEEFDASDGVSLGTLNVSAETETPCQIAFDASNGDLYVAGQTAGLWRLTAASGYHAANVIIGEESLRVGALAVDPQSHFVYVAATSIADGSHSMAAFNPSGGLIEEFGDETEMGKAVNYVGAAINSETGVAYAGDSRNQKVYAFDPQVVPDVSTEAVSSVTQTSAVVHGHIDPAGGGEVTECEVEWGVKTTYSEPPLPCSPPTPYSGPEDVTAAISGLEPGRTYHYRVVAGNANGRNLGEDGSFTTATVPSIEGVFADKVSESGAELHARVNPHSFDTTYWFEYGSTANYGTKIPLGGGSIEAGQEAVPVSATLSGLNGGTYHFRVVAENPAGTAVSEDQTFNFFPTACPNATLRQETSSEYLPDCRAYELVSPGNAGNVIFKPEGAAPGPEATNPPRFAYLGELGGVTGTEPVDALNADTYVATRTSLGWKTALVGLKGSEVLADSLAYGDLGLDKFMDLYQCCSFEGMPQPLRNLPYVWDAEGNFLERWPSTEAIIPGAEETFGAYQPSPDFSHLAFSSRNVAFTPNGTVSPPGSAYDYDTQTGSTTLISVLPGGEELSIPQDPNNAGSTEEYIHFAGLIIRRNGDLTRYTTRPIDPGVSTDGSHILMTTATEPFSGFGLAPPVHLYMRVNDAVTYEIAGGHAVRYVGMRPDGSEVFLTSAERLTNDDTDSSVDLYVWREATDSLTLISQGSGGTGNGDNCEASWTEGCDAAAVEGGFVTDSPIAKATGEIYFYSPEQLDGENGEPGEENLYVYRDGSPQFVAMLPNQAGVFCREEAEFSQHCANGPIERIQVSPDGRHAAFLTANRLTPTQTNGFREMYRYEPDSGHIVCVSCMPNGEPPNGDADASLQGLFMSDDGRTFFYSPDPLAAKDTNELHDVYEYTEGRPQLITTGTSGIDTQTSLFGSRSAGLEGVDSTGEDVYFSTFDTIVGQDQNGQYLKFYDARVGGGFPFVAPPAPCAAADECHGAGSLPPSPAPIVSGQSLGGGGNAARPHGKKHRRKRHHRRRRHARHGHGRHNRAHHGQRRGARKHRGGRHA